MKARGTHAPRFAIYVLGAGFSKPAGLPVANELWPEILQRGLRMDGRGRKFRQDLDEYIEFRSRCFGEALTYETVDFEKFLGYLDIDFHLGLRGSDMWSRHGNEGQVIVKTLIGQVLTERTPPAGQIPRLYLDFARKLQPSDLVITFNYDVLLERAMDQAGVPYRLFPYRYKELMRGGGGILESDSDEVLLLKIHGSLDWFDRRQFVDLLEETRAQGFENHIPHDPVFNVQHPFKLKPVVDGPRPEDDLLGEMFRVLDVERFYGKPPWFLTAPSLVNPSTEKIIYANGWGDFFHGLKQGGAFNFRMVVIGYSLPAHDSYARQVLYHLIDNYQGIPASRFGDEFPDKERLLVVDFQSTRNGIDELKQRYRFVDWNTAILRTDGFSGATLDLL